MLPKRVGLPSTSRRTRQFLVARVRRSRSGTGGAGCSTTVATGGTVRSRALHARHRFDAAAHLARQRRSAALARIIQDQDFVHRLCLSGTAAVRARLRAAQQSSAPDGAHGSADGLTRLALLLVSCARLCCASLPHVGAGCLDGVRRRAGAGNERCAAGDRRRRGAAGAGSGRPRDLDAAQAAIERAESASRQQRVRAARAARRSRRSADASAALADAHAAAGGSPTHSRSASACASAPCTSSG